MYYCGMKKTAPRSRKGTENAASELARQRAVKTANVTRYVHRHAVVLHTIGLDRDTARQLAQVQKRTRSATRAEAVRQAIALAHASLTTKEKTS